MVCFSLLFVSVSARHHHATRYDFIFDNFCISRDSERMTALTGTSPAHHIFQRTNAFHLQNRLTAIFLPNPVFREGILSKFILLSCGSSKCHRGARRHSSKVSTEISQASPSTPLSLYVTKSSALLVKPTPSPTYTRT